MGKIVFECFLITGPKTRSNDLTATNAPTTWFLWSSLCAIISLFDDINVIKQSFVKTMALAYVFECFTD